MRLYILLVNILIVAMSLGLIALLSSRPWEFAVGFFVAGVVFHLGYWAKHGEWWAD